MGAENSLIILLLAWRGEKRWGVDEPLVLAAPVTKPRGTPRISKPVFNL